MQPVITNLIQRLYGKPLIRNVLRGELVEQMILDALGPDWRDAGDYQNWDIEHQTAAWRIQVKQGAAMQSWHDGKGRPSAARFSIGTKAGYSNQRIIWDEPRERRCELYIFAWHPIFGGAVDHREPSQWEFYPVLTSLLPIQKSIGLAQIQSLSAPIEYEGLRSAVLATVS